MHDDDTTPLDIETAAQVPHTPPTDRQILAALRLVNERAGVNVVMYPEIWALVEPWYDRAMAASGAREKRQAWASWQKRIAWLERHIDEALAEQARMVASRKAN